MSTDAEPTAGPRVLPWILGIVAAVVIAAVGFSILEANDDAAPATAQDTLTKLTMGAPQGRCMAPDPTNLARAQTAFAGSVVSVEGGVVTLQPTRWYAGEHTDRVTVRADPGPTDLIGAVDFRPGKDYLVAANNGTVMVCGFSGEKSSDLASLYAQAFPDAAA